IAGGVLTHYSAAPYAVVLAVAWVLCGRSHVCESAWWRQTLLALSCTAAIAMTWFGWATTMFGFNGTFLTNTSVQTMNTSWQYQLATIGYNIWSTLVPHFLR